MDWKGMANRVRAAKDDSEPDAASLDVDRLTEGLADIIADSERRNADEMEKLKARIAAIENRTHKRAAADSENGDARALADLAGELDELRTAMIKLSSRVKALAGER